MKAPATLKGAYVSKDYEVVVLDDRFGNTGQHHGNWRRDRLSEMFVAGKGHAKFKTDIDVDASYFFQCRGSISVWAPQTMTWNVVYHATSDDLLPLRLDRDQNLAIRRNDEKVQVRLSMVEKRLLDYAYKVVFA